MRKAIFLDRDGTLNEDTNYPHKLEDYHLLPGVIEGLKKLQNEFIFIIVTNQSGIGRGIFSEEDYHAFHNHLLADLKKHGIEIAKTYYSKSHPNEPDIYRKPNPTSLNEAAQEFDLDLSNSWVLGDHGHDVQFGINGGCKTIYLLTGHGQKHLEEFKQSNIKATHIANNFMDATNYILDNDN